MSGNNYFKIAASFPLLGFSDYNDLVLLAKEIYSESIDCRFTLERVEVLCATEWLAKETYGQDWKPLALELSSAMARETKQVESSRLNYLVAKNTIRGL